MTDFLDVVNRMGLVVIPASDGRLLVEGDVDLSGSDIATLPDNLTIVGSLIARECARLSALPAGLDIMDSLDLRNTAVTELPEDWCIDGPLLLDVEKIGSPLAWRGAPLRR